MANLGEGDERLWLGALGALVQHHDRERNVCQLFTSCVGTGLAG